MNAPKHVNKETLWVQCGDLQHEVSELEEHIIDLKAENRTLKNVGITQAEEIERLLDRITELEIECGATDLNQASIESMNVTPDEEPDLV